ncbi:UNKNOWN [Stylonychia lemnae]|uniref:Uncharacterized protein n=1 Tax=Stylonychia lemnae TaxID=5949 RepID=A0A078AIA9_STYLE|nr:UNKNOWN [Stylonychia lemnae]|eukprot:CDW80543.1 UNKNOWN [Stylonychia lemnae]
MDQLVQFSPLNLMAQEKSNTGPSIMLTYVIKFQSSPQLISKQPKKKIVVKIDKKSVKENVLKQKYASNKNIMNNDNFNLRTDDRISQFDMNESSPISMLPKKIYSNHKNQQSISNISSQSSVVIGAKSMMPQSGQNLNKNKDRLIKKNKKIMNNVIIKSRKGSYGGANAFGSLTGLSPIQNKKQDQLRIGQDMASARNNYENPISSILQNDQQLVQNQMNSRNQQISLTVKHQTTKTIQFNDRELQFGQDGVIHRHSQSIYQNNMANNQLSNSVNNSESQMKKSGILQKLKVNKRPIITLKKNKFSEPLSQINEQHIQQQHQSPYQQPYPAPIQGSLRKSKMERYGLSQMRARNHSYGGSGDNINVRNSIMEFKMPQIVQAEVKSSQQQRQMKKSMQLNNIVENNEEIIIQDQQIHNHNGYIPSQQNNHNILRQSIIAKPPKAKALPPPSHKKQRDSLASNSIGGGPGGMPRSQMDL